MLTVDKNMRTEFRVYKKEKAASKEAARCLRKQFKTELGEGYLGSIIKSQ